MCIEKHTCCLCWAIKCVFIYVLTAKFKNEKQEFANEVSRGLQALNVVVEQYPDLKASQNVAKLQDATLEVEENLQASRRVYNSNVSIYNQKVVVFPSNIIANWKKFAKRDFFEADEIKRGDVNFDF